MATRAIVDATMRDGSRVDVLVDGEQVTEVGRGVGASADDQIDAAGGLLLPAYIDTHIHLDKVLIRDQLVEHDGTLAGAIGAIHAAKRAYTVEDVRRRARAVIEGSVLTGTTRLRSHVDVDTVGGLVPLEGVLAAARDCASDRRGAHDRVPAGGHPARPGRRRADGRGDAGRCRRRRWDAALGAR